MAEVVRDEYETGIAIRPVPMFVQSGDERYTNVNKMVLKEADVLPHGLINEVETKIEMSQLLGQKINKHQTRR
jgi:methylaspartate ammonia-lyase